MRFLSAFRAHDPFGFLHPSIHLLLVSEDVRVGGETKYFRRSVPRLVRDLPP